MSAVLEKHDIDSEYAISPEQVEYFAKQGFIQLKQVLSPEALEFYGNVITEKVFEVIGVPQPMEERETYNKAFLQVGDLYEYCDTVKEFVMGKTLGKIAADLMETRGARLYHDQALYKESSGGLTPWHVDQQYWPLASEKCCTAWIPLQDTPVEMGPIAFAHGSHTDPFGRDLIISDESEKLLSDHIDAKGYPHYEEGFNLGDVCFHWGWTHHHAGPNTTGKARKVMTMIYMDIDMRLKAPENQNQQNDRDKWCPGIEVGAIIDSHMNPVIYER